MAIRNSGDREAWLKFFLRGVYEVSQASTNTAREILHLREQHRKLMTEKMPGSINGLKLLDRLFEKPIITIRLAQEFMNVSYVTASSVIGQLTDLGILREITGQKRNKAFRYDPYVHFSVARQSRCPGIRMMYLRRYLGSEKSIRNG